jgi:exodeoxyribonuclease VII small subunit
MPERPEAPDLSGLTFEQALERLDQTVKAMESGGLSLADATRLFEEGMQLARMCNEMLASAELRISRIQTAYGEQMQMRDEDGGSATVGHPTC